MNETLLMYGRFILIMKIFEVNVTNTVQFFPSVGCFHLSSFRYIQNYYILSFFTFLNKYIQCGFNHIDVLVGLYLELRKK